MIKLRKLIYNESITSIDISSPGSIEDIIKYATEMGPKNQILWRGIRGKGQTSSILHIIQDRREFFGTNYGAKKILSYLKVTYPIFVYSGNPSYTNLFGMLYAIVLKPQYRLFQSKEVDDISVWARPEIYKTDGGLRSQIGVRTSKQQSELALQGAKTYVELKDTNNLPGVSNEIIVDCKEYWAVHVKHLVWVAGGRANSNITRYEELIEILNSVKK